MDTARSYFQTLFSDDNGEFIPLRINLSLLAMLLMGQIIMQILVFQGSTYIKSNGIETFA